MPNYDLGTARGRIVIDSSTLGRSTAALDRLGKAMLGVGLLGAIGFGYAVKSAADFEEQMARFKAVTNTPAAEMDKLREKALQLGRDSAFGAGEVFKAFVELGKSGATATEILSGLGDAAVTLAAAGEIPLADASIVLVNALKQFRLPAQDAVHVADLLAGAANASTAEVDDLANSLRYAGPVAAFAGVSIEDTATTLALFANAGIKGSAAGTAMRAMLLGIAGTTPKAEATLRSLGIITADGTNQFYNLDGSLKPLPQVFQILGDSMKNLNPHQKTVALNAIFLRRGLVAAALAATEGADGFGKMREEVGKTTAHDVMIKKLDSLKGSLKILKSSVETFAITIGEQLTPYLKKAADYIRDLVNWFTKLNPETKALLTKIGLAVTAFFLFGGALSFTLSRVLSAYRAFKDLGTAIKIAGGLLSKMTGLNALAKMAWPKIVSGLESLALAFMETGVGAAIAEAPLLLIIAVILLVAAAAWFVWTRWDQIWNWIKDHPAYAVIIAILAAPIAAFILIVGALKWLWNNWDKIWGWIKQAAVDVLDWLTGAWDDVQGTFNDVVKWLGRAVDNIVNFFEKLPGRIKNGLVTAGNAVLNFIKSLPGRIRDLVVGAADWLVDVGPTILGGLAYGLGLGLGSVIAFFFGLPTVILALLTAAGEWLLEKGTETLTGFYNGLTSFLGTLLQFFIDLPGVIITTLGDVGVWLFETGISVITGLYNGFVNFWSTAIQFFIDMQGWITTALSDAGSWLIDTGISVIAGFASGLPGRFASVLSWFAGLPGSIIGALGDVGGWLVEAGKKVIGGLLEGIKDGFNKVKDFVSGIADTIASLKGPLDYDAKLLIPAGQKIMEGLLDGAGSRMKMLEDFFSSIAPKLQMNVTAAQTASALSAGGTLAPPIPAIPDAVRRGNETAGIMTSLIDAMRDQQDRNGRGFRDLIVQAPTPNPVDVGFEVARRHRAEARRTRR